MSYKTKVAQWNESFKENSLEHKHGYNKRKKSLNLKTEMEHEFFYDRPFC